MRNLIAWLFSSRYRCWRRGEHRYREESCKVYCDGEGYREVLSKWKVWRLRCTCCGHVRKEKSPKRKKIDWFSGASLPSYYFENIREHGFHRLTDWK